MGDLIHRFDAIYEDLHDFYEKCKERGRDLPGDRAEYKRDTDLYADAPFCPYNLRMRS